MATPSRSVHEAQSGVSAEHVEHGFVLKLVTGKMFPVPCLQCQTTGKCSMHLFTVSDKQIGYNAEPTCPVRSGCQASVQIVIIEIAENWKTDATAPERLSSATGGVALQAGTADRHKPAEMLTDGNR